MKSKASRIIIIAFSVLITAVLAFFVLSYILEFKPDLEMDAYDCSVQCDTVCGNASTVIPDSLRIMSWNIGYAGLGDNMDFCVDGGKQVRDSRERTEENLSDIIATLRAEEADIYLLQEVDKDSHRTYGIDEVSSITKAFPGYFAYYAPNFKVWFVPSPLKEPIGRVNSGLLILSRIKPVSVRRIQYPSAFPFPVSMFNLKRCLLEADFRTADNRVIHIGNTHNTAFDTGGMRTQENQFLQERISGYAAAGELFIVGGDWNQFPPQYSPSEKELENEFFVPQLFDTTGMASYSKVACDTSRRSMRFNDMPYSSSSTHSILDFFLLSRNGLTVSDMKIIDLNFHSSDHNPVIMEVKME